MKIKKIVSLLACSTIGLSSCMAAHLPGNLNVPIPNTMDYAINIVKNFNPGQYYNLDKIKNSANWGIMSVYKSEFPKVSPKDYDVEAPYITKDYLAYVAREAAEIFKNEPSSLKIDTDKGVIIVGDLHGDIDSAKNILLNFLNLCKEGKVDNILFLGDYTDREFFGSETLTLLYTLKSILPNNIHLIRGNHENLKLQDEQIYNTLLSELNNKYNVNLTEKESTEEEDVAGDSLKSILDDNICDENNVELIKSLENSYNLLPAAASVSVTDKAKNESIKCFCVHGGLSRELADIKCQEDNKEQGNNKKPINREKGILSIKEDALQIIEAIQRPCNSDSNNLVKDLTWNENMNIGVNSNKFIGNDRGTKTCPGKLVQEFLKNNEFSGIVTGHMHVNKFNKKANLKQTVLLSSERFNGNPKCKSCVAKFDVKGVSSPIEVANIADQFK